MTEAPQVHHLSATLSVWQIYDPAVKADLFVTRLATALGTYLIDPFPLGDDDFQSLVASADIAAIVVTNANHVRASAYFAQRLSIPIYAHPETRTAFGGVEMLDLSEQRAISFGLSVIGIDGAVPGEIALHYAGDGGTLVFGDALINTGSYGFAFLPPKYCTNPKLMRRSLAKVLDFDFERILFAHGLPIVSQARPRLIQLLGK